MNAFDALRAHALVGLPVGLVTGLLLGLVARHQGGWGGYASERRRAARLSHISLVMLPAISGLYGVWLAGAARPDLVAWGACLFIPGSVALSVALAILAARPSWKAVLPLPAMTVVAGSILFAFAGLPR
jgi:hypothetical protein